MPATTYHRKIDAENSVFGDHGNNIDVFALATLDVLLVLHLAQGADLVTIERGLFKGEFIRGAIHRIAESSDDLLVFAEQEERRHLDVPGVVVALDQVDARPGAALDLVQQTRS